jgi:hypothetical protein
MSVARTRHSTIWERAIRLSKRVASAPQYQVPPPPLAGLVLFGRIDAEYPDATARNLDRVAVNDPRWPLQVGFLVLRPEQGHDIKRGRDADQRQDQIAAHSLPLARERHQAHEFPEALI